MRSTTLLVPLALCAGCASAPLGDLTDIDAALQEDRDAQAEETSEEPAESDEVPPVVAPSDSGTPGELEDDGELTESMGMPKYWETYAGFKLVLDDHRDGPDAGLEGFAGIYKGLGNPLVGILGFVGEAYANVVGGDLDGGLRAMFASPVIYLQAGLDYSVNVDEADFILSLNIPLRRGGPIGWGDTFRVDWIPERDSIAFGLSIPFGNKWKGKTRPKHDEVTFPKIPVPSVNDEETYVASAELQEALGNVEHAADWIRGNTTPFFDHEAKNSEQELEQLRADLARTKEHWAQKSDLYPEGHTALEEARVYHEQLERAFGLVSAERGVEVADVAREILLDEIVIPYDRTLGQRKERDSILGLAVKAEKRFGESVAAMDLPDGGVGARYVFRTLIEALDEDREDGRQKWSDNRYVWLPLRLGLKGEDFDTQQELDELLERVVERDFIGGNEIHYVINEQFQVEFARSVLEAEDYHVLWIHDFRGKTEEKDLDGDRLRAGRARLPSGLDRPGQATTTRPGKITSVHRLPRPDLLRGQRRGALDAVPLRTHLRHKREAAGRLRGLGGGDRRLRRTSCARLSRHPSVCR